MVIDGHIHIRPGARDRQELLHKLTTIGIDGGALISLPPEPFLTGAPTDVPTKRLADLLFWCDASPNLYPLFWIDPTADDALAQVSMAVERGVAGFKVICSHHFPGDERALKTYRAIAAANRPILFHSGILWDGTASARYNRPGEFEDLLEIDGLRFCLAHISWPWCDELIAVYGKFLNAYTMRPDLSVEMFIDITPGTPPIYRRDALTKLFTVGYDVQHNVIFGSDSNANDYNTGWVEQWLQRDRGIFRDLELSQETIDGIYGQNFERFLGLTANPIEKTLLRPGE